MKILYPWIRPEPRTLLWRLPAAPSLRKAWEPLPTPGPGTFLRLVEFLSSQEGRARFPRLLRELANGGRVRRSPRRIVGIVQ